jgi:hypothetical protein
MPIYAISRARIQYLGQNVPFFKYQHSLFEALISALHPDDVSPLDTDNVTNLTSMDISRQEKNMYRYYIIFRANPILRPLLDMS